MPYQTAPQDVRPHSIAPDIAQQNIRLVFWSDIDQINLSDIDQISSRSVRGIDTLRNATFAWC